MIAYVNKYESGPDLLGAMTWKGEIKEYMKPRLKHFPKLLKLSQNNRVIDNIHREYMSLLAKGFTKADILSGTGDFVKWNRQTYTMAGQIADRLNVPKLLVLNFFLSLYNLARSGKVPFEKWNPKGYDKSKKLQKTFVTEKGFLEKTGDQAGKITKLLMPLSIGAGIITALVMLQKQKR